MNQERGGTTQTVQARLEGLQPWRCPRCKGSLLSEIDLVHCQLCGSSYQCIDGIPDLRVVHDSWVEPGEDLEQSRYFAKHADQWTLEEMLRNVFSISKVFTQREIDTRVRRVLEGIDTLVLEAQGWLSQPMSAAGYVLDLGCGPGQLISAAARCGHKMIGVDVRMLWLLVAKRLITANGGTPILAAGLAEALPLADDALSAVISLDVIEHVSDVPDYLRSIDRVTGPGGWVALSTPNRYSLAAEPHIGVWGVGWVPRRWQKRYVKLTRGCDYNHCCLLSVRELQGLLKELTEFQSTFFAPPIPPHEIRRFSARRQLLGSVYNFLCQQDQLKHVLLSIGPFFRVLGRKPTH